MVKGSKGERKKKRMTMTTSPSPWEAPFEVELLAYGVPHSKEAWSIGQSGRRHVWLVLHDNRISLYSQRTDAKVWSELRFDLTTTVLSTPQDPQTKWHTVTIQNESNHHGIRLFVPPHSATDSWVAAHINHVLGKFKATHILLGDMPLDAPARKQSKWIHQAKSLNVVSVRSSDSSLEEMRIQQAGSALYFVCHKHKLISLCAIYQQHAMGRWDQPIRFFLIVSDLLWGITLTLFFRHLANSQPLEKWHQSLLSIFTSVLCTWTVKSSLTWAMRCTLLCGQILIFLGTLVSVWGTLGILMWQLVRLNHWSVLQLVPPFIINIACAWLAEILFLFLSYHFLKACCPCCVLDDRPMARADAMANDQAWQQLRVDQIRAEKAADRKRVAVGELHEKVAARVAATERASAGNQKQCLVQ
jgi:hypothetical protein